ncbi:MAG: type I secretion system permease/ATPase [Pseudomonadota bacterium]
MSRPRDPLSHALVLLADGFGVRTTEAAITAGIGLVNGRLPIEHIEIAGANAGLDARLTSARLNTLKPDHCPFLAETHDGDWWLVQSIAPGATRKQKPQFQVVRDQSRGAAGGAHTPNNAAPLAEVVDAETFAASYSGRTVRATPLKSAATRDKRSDAAAKPTEQNWFLSAFRESTPIYAQAIAATVAVNLLALAIPLFSMNVYDRVIPNAAEATLWALGIGVAIAIVFELTIRTLRAMFVDVASRRADVRLSNMIYARLLGARAERQPSSVGVRANTMREFETLREFFTSATLTAFGDLPFLVLFVGVIYIVAGNLAFLVLGAIPILLLVGWITQRALAKLMQDAFREAAQKQAVVVETLYGMDTLKASGAETWAARKWEHAVAEQVRTGLKIKQVTNLGQHVIQAGQTLLQIAMVVCGYYMVVAGDLTMGAMIAATILSGRAVAPLVQAAGLLVRLNQARMAYQSLTAIVTLPQERTAGQALVSMPTIKGAIDFEDAGFIYAEGAPPALKAVSFRVSPGEKIAILGPIGGGKSTALKLIQAHQVPDVGRVLIDGIPAHQIQPADLRRNVGFLLQGADLFHGTLRENIALGVPGARDDDVLVAARASGALDWMVRLPDGLDTLVRERGAGLSNGQKQSVALARVLLSRPSIVLLDEPTSDMDTGTEARVLQRLKVHLADRTLIVVTHRHAALELVDRVIVINGGRKIHDGPKDAVLAVLRGEGAPGAKQSATPPRQVNAQPTRSAIAGGAPTRARRAVERKPIEIQIPPRREAQ